MDHESQSNNEIHYNSSLKKENSRWVLPVVMRRDFIIIKQRPAKIFFFFVFVLEVWGRFWLSCYSNFLQENKKVKHLNHVSSSEVNFRFNFWHYYGYYQNGLRISARVQASTSPLQGRQIKNKQSQDDKSENIRVTKTEMKANARSPTRQQQLVKGKPTQSNQAHKSVHEYAFQTLKSKPIFFVAFPLSRL